MNSKTIYFILIALGISGCSRIFYDYDRSDFKYIDKLDKKYVPTIQCIEKAYVMRLDTLDKFIGSEYVRMRDTTSKKSMVQYSYFVFQKNGRVYFNTYADARDSTVNKKYEDEFKHIDGEIPQKINISDPLNYYSRHGHYSIVNYEAVIENNTAKEIYSYNQDKIFIEIEMERKYNPRLHNRKKNRKHHDKHYIVTAAIEINGDSIVGDTLDIIRIEVPREINPLTAESSPSKKGNQVMKASDIFAFPLKFMGVKEFPEMFCENCQDTIDCKGCLKSSE